MTFGNERRQAAMLRRRREVKRLHARGLSTPEIAEALQVDRRTVQRDRQALGIGRQAGRPLKWADQHNRTVRRINAGVNATPAAAGKCDLREREDGC